MSSMKNATQRRAYKERAQPLERQKWGLLEKHKDYSLRAKDYNAKKARLKILRQKASERNPDEFSYSMLSSSSKHGKKQVDRQNPVLDHHVSKLLKTQDLGYVQTMLQTTRQHISRMETRTTITNDTGSHLTPSEHQAQKIVFVENQNDQTAMKRDQSGLSIVSNSTPKSSSHPVTREEKRGQRIQERKQKMLQLSERAHKSDSARLEILKERVKVLRSAEIELDLQRAKMANTIGGVSKAGVKWRVRERKR